MQLWNINEIFTWECKTTGSFSLYLTQNNLFNKKMKEQKVAKNTSIKVYSKVSRSFFYYKHINRILYVFISLDAIQFINWKKRVYRKNWMIPSKLLIWQITRMIWHLYRDNKLRRKQQVNYYQVELLLSSLADLHTQDWLLMSHQWEIQTKQNQQKNFSTWVWSF